MGRFMTSLDGGEAIVEMYVSYSLSVDVEPGVA